MQGRSVSGVGSLSSVRSVSLVYVCVCVYII